MIIKLLKKKKIIKLHFLFVNNDRNNYLLDFTIFNYSMTFRIITIIISFENSKAFPFQQNVSS